MFEFRAKRSLTFWSKPPVLEKLLEKARARKIARLTGSLSGNAFENIVDERVEDGHRLVRDTGIRVNLLEN